MGYNIFPGLTIIVSAKAKGPRVFGNNFGKICQGHSTHDTPSELKTRKSS